MKTALLYGVPVGTAGGLLLSAAGLVTPVVGAALGCVYGLFFCLVAAPRACTPGGGLLWGLACALLFWLAVPAARGPWFESGSPGSMMALDRARARFADLVGYVLFSALRWASFLER